MTARQHTHSRLLAGKSGTGRRARRRRSQFPEPVRTGSRRSRVTPASKLPDVETDVADLVESALRDRPPLDLTDIDDRLSSVSS